MEKAILIKTGIKLNVIGESESIVHDDGEMCKSYRVIKEIATDMKCSFRVSERDIVFI